MPTAASRASCLLSNDPISFRTSSYSLFAAISGDISVVSHYSGPLLTRPIAEALLAARDAGDGAWMGSLDLGRSNDGATLQTDVWHWKDQPYPFPGKLKDRTIYYWDGEDFAPVSRFSGSLIKLVPTEWGAPTFEIDGIKMLPTAKDSPFEDARRKVALVEPQGKIVLDTCGGLGYFAACCLDAGVARIHSFEKNPDVLWLRMLNPWSPDPDAATSGGRLQLEHGDVSQTIMQIADSSVDALLHDPPRFGIAGELYSQAFYDQLARVLRRGGRLFHYTGSPNKLTSARDVPREVEKRLEKAGFKAQLALDGVLATRR
jgi:predicted methyltransferase